MSVTSILLLARIMASWRSVTPSRILLQKLSMFSWFSILLVNSYRVEIFFRIFSSFLGYSSRVCFFFREFYEIYIDTVGVVSGVVFIRAHSWRRHGLPFRRHPCFFFAKIPRSSRSFLLPIIESRIVANFSYLICNRWESNGGDSGSCFMDSSSVYAYESAANSVGTATPL